MAERPPDTIAAVATAPGRGGIGVVRVSGADLKSWFLPLFGKSLQPRLAILASFRAADASLIDQGIALYFPAPHSFTGEDVLELQGHGGPVVLQMVLQRCLELGARVAEPGEFTKRAYLNDKLDLAQAESVADIIDASTTAAARSAMRSLSGEFSSAVQGLERQLIDLRLLIEATLDFPEEEIDVLRDTDALARLRFVEAALGEVLQRARKGSVLRSGLQVVLVGQPNVGKSSLLNRLSGEERAIVTDVPGTTRDALREHIEIEGVPIHVIDTAGLRDTEDEVERIGISRTWAEIGKADLIVLLLDVRKGISIEDENILSRLPEGVERLTVFNKVDLDVQGASRRVGAHGVELSLSARTGEGVELLHDELLRVAGFQTGDSGVFAARERHLEALRLAQIHLDAAGVLLEQPELFAEELRLCQDAVCRITGKFSADDLLGEIFSRFCIGK